MAVSLHTTLRNNRQDQVTSYLGNAARLRLYTTSRAVLLAELVCGTPFAGASVGGVLTMNVAATSAALATGGAVIADLYRADGTTLVIAGLSVSDNAGNGDIKLDQTGVTITSGNDVVFQSGSFTDGNP